MPRPSPGRRLLVFGNHTVGAAIDLGTPALADDDFYVEDGDASDEFFVINKTLGEDEPPRDVTLTVTEVSAEDTVEAIVLVGRDDLGNRIREVIDASDWDDSVVFESVHTYRTLETVELVGHVVASATDTIDVGFGDYLGLGVKIIDNRDVFLATLGTAIVSQDAADAVVGNVGTLIEDLSKNKIDLSAGTYNGAKVARVLLNPPTGGGA